MPTLRRDGDVHVLDLGDDENQFHPDWLASVREALDTVVAKPAPLVTVGGGKFYSNGLDLGWLGEHGHKAGDYLASVHDLLATVLTLPVPTVAAVNGHAFGAGAMLAVAHDFRVMRTDRGYFCFPEADINIPFTGGMAALIQAKTTPATAVGAMTTARRYDGPSAVAAGLVDEAAEQADVLPRAVARVAPLAGKDSGTVGAIKRVMFAKVVEALSSSAFVPAPLDV